MPKRVPHAKLILKRLEENPARPNTFYARRFDISAEYVRSLRSKHNIPSAQAANSATVRSFVAVHPEASLRQIADACNVSPSFVRQEINDAPRHFYYYGMPIRQKHFEPQTANRESQTAKKEKKGGTRTAVRE